MNKKHLAILATVLFAFVLATLADAAPMVIRPIGTAAQFIKRQSPKPVIKPIDLQPLDIADAKNLKEARSSVMNAHKKVADEIADQERVLKSQNQRITKMNQRIVTLQAERKELVQTQGSIQQELDVLRGISNPSAAITACISELEGDLAQTKQQIKNIDTAVTTLRARIAFVQKAGKDAHLNITQLKQADANLRSANAALAKLIMSELKPELRRPVRLAPRARPKRPMIRR